MTSPHGEPTAAATVRSRRGPDGRFIADGDLHTRYSAIAEVLRAANPDRPDRVSTRQFDAARARAGHDSLPRAQSLTTWLGMPWAEVKTVALDENRDKVRTYRSRNRAPARPWRDVDSAARALKRVAEALGQDRLAATVYDNFRESAPAATRELLPTSAQVIKLAGSWDRALALAGLGAPRSRAQRGLPVVEAIGLFARTQGRLPGPTELTKFAADPRWAFPMQRIGDRRWQGWLTDFEAWWVGELNHERPPSEGRRPFVPLSDDEIALLPKPARPPKGWWTRDRVIDCVVTYLEEHPNVARLRQQSYRAWAKERTARGVWTASPHTLTRFGTLEELEREARQKMRVG